jgi:hypothetical protein
VGRKEGTQKVLQKTEIIAELKKMRRGRSFEDFSRACFGRYSCKPFFGKK